MLTTRVTTIVAIVALWLVATSTNAQQRPPQSEADGAVATEIEHRLTRDRQVDAQTIDIDVRGGVVTLSGRVAAEDAKQRAEALAAAVPGVSKVHNEIAVSAGVRGGGP